MKEETNNIDVHSLERVVCIMSYTSSASGLMASLFDNHPNVLMFPDNVISGFQNFWEKNQDLSLDAQLDNFLIKYVTIFDARETPTGLEGSAETGESRGYTTLGINRDEYLLIDRLLFKRNVKELIGDVYPVSRKLFFQAIHIAYNQALGREIKDPIIVFGLHNLTFPERIKAIKEDFSDISFLTMVRNPINATGSRFRSQLKASLAISHFKKIMNGIANGGTFDPSTDPGQWKAVRMEDLHRSPDKTMKKICDWLNLEWNNSLLESTIHGKKWWNEKQSMQISGFNPAIPAQNFDEFLSKFDQTRLNILLSHKSATWNYSNTSRGESFILKACLFPLLFIPFRIELIVWKKIISKIISKEISIFYKTWIILKTIMGGLLLGRLILLRSWINNFIKPHKEVELL
jgi:hypothetical protein